MEEWYIEPELSMLPSSEGKIELQTIFSKQEYRQSKKNNLKKCILITPGAFHNAELMKDLQYRIFQSFKKRFPNHQIIVHTFSQLGHGKSELKGCLHLKSFNTHVNVLEEIIQIVGNEIILIGHSLGGLVIEKYLEKNRALAVALLAPFNHSIHFKKDVIKHLLRHQKRTILYYIFTWSPKRSFTPTAFKKLFYSAECDSQEYNNRVEGIFEKISDESLRCFMGAFLTRLDYRKISRTPIIIIGGEKDVAVQRQGLELLGKKLSSNVHMIPNATHNTLINDKTLGIEPKQGHVREVAENIAKFVHEIENVKEI
ncbi:MAG: alpha/beta fold hydrolase [Candidatus Heimdallarchaeota archaeon]|nr:alpha/beta fold hydrolase [Candidatus Heimdallarchaeota archaeon]